MQNAQYFHITKDGQIKDWHNTLSGAKYAEKMFVRSDCELIDSEELYYRKVAWLNENGYDYDDVMEDEKGEYVIEENHNYGHPSDTGASIDSNKVYIQYFPVVPSLENAIVENSV